MPSAAAGPVASSPRRNSSGDSLATGPSDSRGWFDRSNQNPTNFNGNAMDIDPPFFQKETDSSNDGPLDSAYPYGPGARQMPNLQATVAQSSSADDFRSVIDDLTIENKRLKEELKRYKQFGPDMMRREKLFEIKVHGLPKRKKRELEATLRDFAASLEGSSESQSQRKTPPGRHPKSMYSSGETRSKHASSSSSRSRPVDSAYASMSTGPSSNARSRAPHSTSASQGRPSASSRPNMSADQKVEEYLRDTPDGLFPRSVVMTDKDRKKLVVRRLEQLFTGKMGGKRDLGVSTVMSSDNVALPDPAVSMAPPRNLEAAREAFIQPPDSTRKKLRSRDNQSSNSNGDQTESGGNGMGVGDGGSSGRTGVTTSPTTLSPPEQRPTRPKDLDPDRVQVPSENMDYMRHLGFVSPENQSGKTFRDEHVSPDADGWVYLNLLCNLAQLHMVNVTPNFIRLAVSEKSTKFQLSPDGRKLRWLGGTDGTKFSSDSSRENSHASASPCDTDGSNGRGQRKKLKTRSGEGATSSGPSSKELKLEGRMSNSSDSFHYKPMFVRQSSSTETSLECTASQGSDGAANDSNPGNTGHSRWDYSGSGSTQRKLRRHDGAIVYYNGAPFCIDLSGDAGDISPTTYMTSTGRELESVESSFRHVLHRTLSGSSLPVRPLSDPPAIVSEALDRDLDSLPRSWRDYAGSDLDDAEFPWCHNPEELQARPIQPLLEACGLGGVQPEDHFAVIVTTRRSMGHENMENRARAPRSTSVDSAEVVLNRLASMSTSSPHPPRSTTGADSGIEIEYVGGKLRKMSPMPLPPPAMFFPPFSSDSESVGDDDDTDSDDEVVSEEDLVSTGSISQRANPHLSENTDSENYDTSDEERVRIPALKDTSAMSEDSDLPIARAILGTDAAPLHTGSSVATAGGEESGYNSSMEDDAQ